MEYVLTTEHLCKNYGHFKALNQCSMHVPRGAIYGFVGKNGAGKTTLIRLICGLQRPTSGSYRLYGSENTDKKIVEAQRRIGAVVETPVDLCGYDGGRKHERAVLCFGLAVF